MNHLPTPPRHNDAEIPADQRRTVIPTPRSNSMFPGWGVRF